MLYRVSLTGKHDRFSVEQLDSRVESYASDPVSEWTKVYEAWIGFYKELQRRRKDSDSSAERQTKESARDFPTLSFAELILTSRQKILRSIQEKGLTTLYIVLHSIRHHDCFYPRFLRRFSHG